MKKILAAILTIPFMYLVLWLLPYICKFIEWLIVIDNTDFGFPLWLDFGIDAVAGAFAYFITGEIFDAIRFHDKEAMSTTNKIISIIIGFVIAVIVHIFLQYWYIILSVVIGILLAYIVICIIVIKKKKAK